MIVVRAQVLGFCMGVSRAVETAQRESSAGYPVYTFGPLIHNPKVLDDLEKRGVRILEEGDIPPGNSTVIIRAHGISPQAESALKKRGVRVLDATCPHVKVSQKKAQAFAENGYAVFLAGGEDHAEIAGIRGYVEAGLPGREPRSADPDAGGAPACHVVGNPAEAEKAAGDLFRRDSVARTVLIGQTTISAGEYMAIGERIRRFFPSLEVLDTICGATADRQEALRGLSAKVDALVIAGGRDSANTRRLLSLARELGKPAWLVEDAADLPPEIASFRTVGLSAGASTPGSLVGQIEEALLSL